MFYTFLCFKRFSWISPMFSKLNNKLVKESYIASILVTLLDVLEKSSKNELKTRKNFSTTCDG